MIWDWVLHHGYSCMLTGTMSACFVSLCTCSSTSAACVWLTDDFFFSAQLRENLEESINQLQTQRPSRSNGARSESASASPLHTSDLEGGSWSGVGSRKCYSLPLDHILKKKSNMISFVIFRRPAFLSHFSTEGLHRHGNTKAQEKEVSVCGCAFQGC